MARTYRVNDNQIEQSDKTEFSNKIEKSIKPVEKTLEILSGSGDWKQLHGIKLLVDPSGTVIKGPDIMISRKWDDIERLSFQDSFTVMRSVMRAIGATNKSFEDDLDKNKRELELQKAIEFLDEAIERGRAANQKMMERQKFI